MSDGPFDVVLERRNLWLMSVPAALCEQLGGPGAVCTIALGETRGHGVVAADCVSIWCSLERNGATRYRGPVVIRRAAVVKAP